MMPAEGLHPDKPCLLIFISQSNLNPLTRQPVADPLGPFNCGHPSSVDHLFHPDIPEVRHNPDPVEVYVVQGEPPLIFPDDDKSGACDPRPPDAQPLGKSFHKAGLSCAELAHQADDIAGREMPSYGPPDRDCLSDTLCVNLNLISHIRILLLFLML